MSLNVVSVDPIGGVISCRLLFVTIPGGVVKFQTSDDELVFRRVFS